MKGQVKGYEKLNTDKSIAHIGTHPNIEMILHCNILNTFFSSPTETF